MTPADGSTLAPQGAPTADPADRAALKQRLRRAERARRLRALGLIAPILLFLLVAFVAPIVDMLLRSVDNSIVPETLPRTVVALEDWDPDAIALPPEAAFVALISDLRDAYARKDHTRLGRRLNHEMAGVSSLFRKTPRRLAPRREAARAKIDAALLEDGAQATLVRIDKDWADPQLWRLIKGLSGAYTASYYLAALDRKIGPDGGVERLPEGERIYLDLFGATLWMSLLITIFALLLGYPAAYWMASMKQRHANLLMILVLLPFWTSLLVRTGAWKTLLQTQGVVNDGLVLTGANAVLFGFLSLFTTPEATSLCQNDLTQLLARGAEGLALMADRVGVQQLSDCALQAVAVYRAEGAEAAMSLVRELDASGRAYGYGDERFAMVDNRTGVVVAMTHILLPFMILPLYAVMRTIPPDYVRAARSLGASRWTAFWRIYFPNSLPGVGAGVVLVFILAIGYYITPELLGGVDGRFISNKIAHHISSSLNWGLAAALASLLLILVLVLYYLYQRVAGADTIRLG